MKQKENCYFMYMISHAAKFLRVPVARQITKTKTFFLQCLTFKNLLFRSLTVRLTQLQPLWKFEKAVRYSV